MTILNEGLEYKDLDGMLDSIISIDEYAAKMGSDSDVVTISFVVYSKMAGEDLVLWFEKGYDFVLDASVSEGELTPGKYLVFVELNRRSKVPERIIKLLSDLETLTDIPIEDWRIKIENKEYPASEKTISKKIILNPNQYRAEKEHETPELNEMRIAAGLEAKKVFDKKDSLLKDFISSAGL
jgi:hypothetical protein